MVSDFYRNEEINNDIRDSLEKILSIKKEHKFCYFIINKSNLNDMCIINNHPRWFDLYIKHRHQMTDPVVIKSLSRVEDFQWDQGITVSSKPVLPKVMLHAQEYDINSGHTFVLHDYQNNLVLLSIFSDAFISLEKEIILNKEQLFSLLVKTHQKILSLDERLEDNINLTQRENDILYLISKGKTYKEVSMITEIQVPTVKFHMRNIVVKLGAVNAKHAIKMASDLKLVTPPPNGVW